MAGVQLDLEHLLLAQREVRRHQLLGAPQHERADPSTQGGQPLRVLGRAGLRAALPARYAGGTGWAYAPLALASGAARRLG